MTLDEIKRIWAAATPGPWDANESPGNLYVYGTQYAGDGEFSGNPFVARRVEAREDQAAIAAAPEQIAWLVGLVEDAASEMRGLAGEGCPGWIAAGYQRCGECDVCRRADRARAWLAKVRGE